METLLVSVTAISLLLATGLAFVAWKLLNDNRARAAARADLLASLADADEFTDDALSIDSETPSFEAERDEVHYAREVAEEAGYDVFRVGSKAGAAPAPRAAAVKPAAPAKPAAPTPGDLLFRHIRSSEDDEMDLAEVQIGSPLFQSTPHSGAGRWIALAATMMVLVVGAGTVLAFHPPSELLASFRHDPKDDQPAVPLELLSLRNGTDSGEFTVTGLVQNPSGAPVLKNVVAVVYLFDQDGKYFASGKAALESASLQPGEESPFVVKIPATGVSRYRVGFRTTDGTVISHVDHRGDTPSGATGVDVGQGQPSALSVPATRPEGTHGH